MKIFMIIILAFLLIGCMVGESTSTSQTVFVKTTRDATVRIKSGTVMVINEQEDAKIFQVHFDKVRGGVSFFLGMKLKEVNGDKEKRLTIYNNAAVKKYSLNEVLRFYKEKMDTMEVYLLPL